MINQLINPVIFEQWIPLTDSIIPDIKPFYLISNFGRIYSIQTNKILIQFVFQKTGYGHVGLRTLNDSSKHFLIHRLVMIAFNPIENPNNMEVNHINGNKLDNCILNLEWCTREQNIQHAWDHDLYHRGENHHNSNLLDEQVIKICEGLTNNLSYDKIANSIGLEISNTLSSCISDIKAGRRWNPISSLYEFPLERSYQLFSNNQIHLICRFLQDNITTDYEYILSNIGINVHSIDNILLQKYKKCIDRIRRKDRFTNISKDYNF